MALADVQRVLARLYTETTLRERYFADPSAVGGECGLSESEIQSLSMLSAEQVNAFAESLHHKRWGEVRKLLPLSVRILGRELFQNFLRYADTNVPQGVQKHREDAIDFAAYLLQREDLTPAWAKEALRYEQAVLQANAPERRCCVRRFPCPAHRLPGTDDPQRLLTTRRPTLLLWFRLKRHGSLKRVTLTLPE